MPNLLWSKLSPIQLGKYAEYYAKMEFTSYGFEVYTSDVDDHGVDFVAKAPCTSKYYEVQVKGSGKGTYVFEPKDKMPLSENRLMCLLNFIDGELPTVYIIPTLEWQNPNGVLVDRCYDKPGQKSKPEWGINVSKKNLPYLEKYKAEEFFKNFSLTEMGVCVREEYPLTNEMIKAGAFQKAQFVFIAASGAMGEGGKILIVQKDGKIYSGNYVYGSLSLDLIVKKFPYIGEEVSDEIMGGISKDGKMYHYYLTGGNHLFVSDEVHDDFKKSTKECKYCDDYGEIWFNTACTICPEKN